MRRTLLNFIIIILSFTALASLTTSTEAQEKDSNSCEQGSMAEVYACLEDNRRGSLNNVYNDIMLKLSNLKQFDALESLFNSQSAWSENVELYCNILIEAAAPDYGLYAYDIGNNCRADLYSRRVEDLSRLIEAIEDKNFSYWTPQ